MEAPDQKVCRGCGALKPIDDFPASPRTKDGHMHKCRDCLRKSQRGATFVTKGKGNVLEEAMDLRITVDGFIDLFPDDDVDTAYALVIEKGIRRGDWDGYADANAPHCKYCANCAHYRKMADVDRHVCVLHNHLAHALCYCSWHKMAEGM